MKLCILYAHYKESFAWNSSANSSCLTGPTFATCVPTRVKKIMEEDGYTIEDDEKYTIDQEKIHIKTLMKPSSGSSTWQESS